jgi:hypothetical protein
MAVTNEDSPEVQRAHRISRAISDGMKKAFLSRRCVCYCGCRLVCSKDRAARRICLACEYGQHKGPYTAERFDKARELREKATGKSRYTP